MRWNSERRTFCSVTINKTFQGHHSIQDFLKSSYYPIVAQSVLGVLKLGIVEQRNFFFLLKLRWVIDDEMETLKNICDGLRAMATIFNIFTWKKSKKIILKNKGKGKRRIFEKDGFFFFFHPIEHDKNSGAAHTDRDFSHGPPQAKWNQICGLRNVN